MEKRGGFRMVTKTLKWTTVSNIEIEEAKFRFEASVFNIEAKKAKSDLEKCRYKTVLFWSDDGLVKNAFYPGRFKRIYVEKGNGFPMVLPSQMLAIKPEATKFISKKTANNVDILTIKKDTLLLTRSGTIGNCTIATNTLEGTTMSDDVIRITFKNQYSLGYSYAFLKTKVGQIILATNNYGSVIQHIEPEHLKEIPIPNPPDELKKEIHEKIMKSFFLRDESNELISKAEKLLFNALKLPDFDELKPDLFNKSNDIQTFSVDFNLLDDRFDVSYHLPIVDKIIDTLLDSGAKILPLGNSELTSKIILPGRFKRTYVDEGEGSVFLGGKQIYELDPSNKKYLSLKQHGGRIESQLFLKENMIAITCSGTIGKVNIIPKHWEKWTMSQHVIRAVPATKNIAGYLYIWLNSEFGRILIERNNYGSVVDEIDERHLSKIPIPIIQDKAILKEINNLALEANRLRSEAYYLEQDAIRQVNEQVIYA